MDLSKLCRVSDSEELSKDQIIDKVVNNFKKELDEGEIYVAAEVEDEFLIFGKKAIPYVLKNLWWRIVTNEAAEEVLGEEYSQKEGVSEEDFEKMCEISKCPISLKDNYFIVYKWDSDEYDESTKSSKSFDDIKDTLKEGIFNPDFYKALYDFGVDVDDMRYNHRMGDEDGFVVNEDKYPNLGDFDWKSFGLYY